ncbi:MAG: radical SAM protein [Thermoleophilia bacterium]|nr:radical SAM protein [Thermoleophilia bacterium]
MIDMLSAYFDILAGKKKPRFHALRSRDTGLNRLDLEGADAGVLWEVHDAALDGLAAGVREKSSRPDNANLLELKQAISRRLLSSCNFCERRCGAKRTSGKTGTCGVPVRSRYASEFFHFGEEAELVPSHTIFFTGCNFSCVYCQNHDIATSPAAGSVADPASLARSIDRGRERGSRNVNFVGGNPDPHLHTCLDIISLLRSDVPVVWNSNAYASREAMKLLGGAVDIYLSDFRYGDNGCAEEYSDVPEYWETVTRNLLLSYRQAELMLRHLVLPGHLDCCTAPIMAWVARNLPGVRFNLMFQYRPEHEAHLHPGIDRSLTAEETVRARSLARDYGIKAA